MSDTKIEWTNKTWNCVRGCSLVSQGCKRCYAMKQAHRMSGPGGLYEGLTVLNSTGPTWTGKVVCDESKLEDPLHWKKPARIFVNSMSDLFHEDVPFEFIDKVFAVMALCPQHTFQILTKRPARMLEYLVSRSKSANYWKNGVPRGFALDWNGISLVRFPLPHVWFGVSVEDRKTWLERGEILKQVPAAVRFISYEPALDSLETVDLSGIQWVIVGGESGPGARPMHPDWARCIRDQCIAAGVPFFFKQWGGVHKKAAGRLLDGREWSEYPTCERKG